ncbi:MAG TPA: hypothetical protein ENH94_02105 [Phycisphaerales bacterium]|nr:hypothetical protein [Phycisphaerales bacterium]
MKKGQVKNVLFCVLLIILMCAMLMWLGGCGDQRCQKWVVGKDGRAVKVLDIRTQWFLREFSSKNAKLHITDDPNSFEYTITVKGHQSKTSAGKIKAIHPTGIGIEIVTE